MKQIWKCEFCEMTSTIKEEIENHERVCPHQKQDKICITCKCIELIPNGFSSGYNAMCRKKYNINFDEKPCEHWEEDCDKDCKKCNKINQN